MVELQFMIWAERSTQDEEKLSLFNVIEDIELDNPILLPPSKLVLTVTRSNKDNEVQPIELETAFLAMDKFTQKFDLNFHGKMGARVTIDFPELPITQNGKIIFTVKHKGKVIGSLKTTCYLKKVFNA